MIDFQVDRAIPVPIAAQIRGQIEYGISYGMLKPGSKLPNVRDLAKRLKVSPTTVSTVYQTLQAEDIIVSTPGRGTFVADNLPTRSDSEHEIVALNASIRQLVAQAETLGLSKPDLINKVTQEFNSKGRSAGLLIAFVGEFSSTSALYVESIREFLNPQDRVEVFTFSDLKRRPDAQARLNEFDLLLTIAHRAGELGSSLAHSNIMAVRFIPSVKTRAALARINPLASVGVISTFPEFLAVLKSGVTTFAPHVQIIDAAVVDTEKAIKLVRTCDVVVYASGSEEILTSLGESTTAVEYLHAPDPTDLARTLPGRIRELRSAREVVSKS